MDQVNKVLNQANVATGLLLLFFVIGAVKVIAGDLEFAALIALLAIPTAGIAVGRGLAAVSLTPITGAVQAMPIITILVIMYAVLGGVQVLTDSLTFEAYLKIMDVPLAGLGIGRGIAANNLNR